MDKQAYIKIVQRHDEQVRAAQKTIDELNEEFIKQEAKLEVGYRFVVYGEFYEIIGRQVHLYRDLGTSEKEGTNEILGAEVEYCCAQLNKKGQPMRDRTHIRLFPQSAHEFWDRAKPIRELDQDVTLVSYINKKVHSKQVMPLSKAKEHGMEWATRSRYDGADRTWAVKEIKGVIYQ